MTPRRHSDAGKAISHLVMADNHCRKSAIMKSAAPPLTFLSGRRQQKSRVENAALSQQ
jgi:hypothetical protein